MSSPRVRFAVAAGVVVAAVLGLIGWSLSGSTAYYRTPSELAAAPTNPAERIRVAGTVVEGSVIVNRGLTRFLVTDGAAEVEVATEDVLPDTFGAGVEVVAEGAMGSGGVFRAATVLTKCPSKFKAKRTAAGLRWIQASSDDF